jgi:hypothetical protein
VEHAPAANWRIREGRIAGIDMYLDRTEALVAAGLPGEFAKKSE